jgi:predicted RNA-binding Zn-ribbon protein involved in translation (DUF1610 family)
MEDKNTHLKPQSSSPSESYLKVSSTTKIFVVLVVIFIILLELISWYLIFSTETIFNFIGYSVFSVLLITFLAYFTFKILRKKRTIFDEDIMEPDFSNEVPNPRLESIFKAEQKYYRDRSKANEDSEVTRRSQILKNKSRARSPKQQLSARNQDLKDSKLKKKEKVTGIPKGVSGVNIPLELPDPDLQNQKRTLKAKSEVKKSSKRKGVKEPGKKLETGKSLKTAPKTSKISSRIGAIPLEESYYVDRVKFQKLDQKQAKETQEKKVTTFLCPECGSRELYYEAGLISGYKYHCKDCDYIGTFIIEKDFKIDE